MVRRVITALSGAHVFVHCDLATRKTVFDEMIAVPRSTVHIVPRRRTPLASWGVVEAELEGLAEAVHRTNAEHLIVMSGSCYPLTSVDELQDELAAWRNISRIPWHPLPFDSWSTRRNRDGGYWRFRRRYLTVRGRIVYVGDVPIRWGRTSVPDGLVLHASSQWKIYARRHVERMLQVLDDHPEQRTFWRRILLPDEALAASILRSPALVGRLAEDVYDDHPWYVKWPEDIYAFHPMWLARSDFADLREAASRPRRAPSGDPAAPPDGYRKLFARKLSSQQVDLLDLIDVELAGRPAPAIS
jgi:hypothetical protein